MEIEVEIMWHTLDCNPMLRSVIANAEIEGYSKALDKNSSKLQKCRKTLSFSKSMLVLDTSVYYRWMRPITRNFLSLSVLSLMVEEVVDGSEY